MKKLYVIDAVNFLFRSYFAIGPMTNPKGESTGALFGFIRTIYKLMEDFSADYLVAVFDGPDNKSSRKEIYSDYKVHRKGMPDDLVPQLEWAKKFCDLAGIPTLCVSGVEADDTMGSVAKWAESQGADVFLCSSDKDLSQLVTDHIFVLNVYKENLLIDKQKVKELFGVEPHQMIDFLAIMGDASDNIPGLEGFGAKTAAALLQEFGSLDALLAHPEKVPGAKKQETLRTGKEIALMSRQLATIHLGVDFPKIEEFFRIKEPDLPEIKTFYEEMHFLSLLKQLNLPESKEEKPGIYELVNEETALRELISQLQKEQEICVDTETTDIRPMRAKLVGVGLCVHPGKAWYIPLKERLLEILRPLFANPHIAFCGHNIKYDAHVLLNEGIPIVNLAFDTMLASYLLTPQNQRHGLDQLSLEKFGKVKIPISDLLGKGKKQVTMAEVPIEQVTTYCCEDVDYTCRLKELFKKDLEKEKLMDLFTEIEMPLLPILLKMERTGIFVDKEKLAKMSEELRLQLGHLEKEIYGLAGEEFNISSPKQLSSILFEKLGLPAPKKTATGFSTSADVLESLQESSPIVQKILDYRGLEKLRSTYVDALPEQIHPETGRVHCTFNQFVAATGRLSCQDPNLQNIPIRSKEGRKIRAAFRPEQPHWSFLAGDYSQIELRLLAHLSEDPSLIKAFQEGEDIHVFTASEVFNVPLKEVTPIMRQRAKAVNFGVIYGQQAFGLSQGLAIDMKEASAFIKTYFDRYKRVKEFLESCKESARKTGRSVTMTGRLRPIPEINSPNPILRAASERLAINTPLQGTAADLIKLAMIEVDMILQRHPSLGVMLLQIHDELLFETPDSQAETLGILVKNAMEQVFTLKVPLVVDISIGKNWEEC